MISLRGRRVYMDANGAIYAVEESGTFPNLKVGLLDPIDMGDVVLEQAYRDLFMETFVKVRPIDTVIRERAIDLRLLGLETPDAIHIATGMIESRATKDGARVGVTVVDPTDLAP